MRKGDCEHGGVLHDGHGVVGRRLILRLNQDRVTLCDGHGEHINPERLDLDTVRLDDEHIVLVDGDPEHYLSSSSAAIAKYLLRGHTGKGRHVDDTNLVCLAGHEWDCRVIANRITGADSVGGGEVGAVLDDVHDGGICAVSAK